MSVRGAGGPANQGRKRAATPCTCANTSSTSQAVKRKQTLQLCFTAEPLCYPSRLKTVLSARCTSQLSAKEVACLLYGAGDRPLCWCRRAGFLSHPVT